MSILTPFFNLIKPAKNDPAAIAQINANMDTIDTEMHKPPLTVNGIEPDAETRDLALETVPYAENLASDIVQVNTGTFIQRTSGGDASVGNGIATMVSVSGNYVRTGYVPESINMTVNATNENITATIDRETFVAYVQASATITLNYTNSWSTDPTLYGITVTGTPVNGDSIVVVYQKENRGTISPATPSSFNSTGWNLYNNATRRARVIKYSNYYGFRIDGAYTSISFATTTSGAQTSITVTGGNFTIPSDGYIFVNGGNDTTAVYATWSDWTDGYTVEFEPYTVSAIELSEIMLSFPYGLCMVGDVRDEINFSTGVATRRIGRTPYENLSEIIAYGYAYVTDTNYVYYVLPPEEVEEFTITESGEYTVSDHGIEFYNGTTIPVATEILYEENLKDKLRRDVVTLSEQTLTDPQKAQVRANIGAASQAEVTPLGYQFFDVSRILVNNISSAANLNYTATEDCFVNCSAGPLTSARTIYINDVAVAVTSNATISSNKYYFINFSCYLKAGDTIRCSGTVRHIIAGLKR